MGFCAVSCLSCGMTSVPVAVRQSAADGVESVTKSTFAEATLRGIANALASDAPFGRNSANLIREKVERIADSVADPDPDTHTSSGRAVLEARFAMGHDDSQYLAQSVVALWAGDGGDRLRLVHASALPTVIKAASARGVLTAMEGLIEKRRQEQGARLADAVDLASWLLCVEEVRNAVVDTMLASRLQEVATGARSLEQAYAQSDQAGVAHLKQVHRAAHNGGEELRVVGAVLEGMYVLTCPSSRPCQVVDRLEEASRQVVRRTFNDTAALLDAALLLGGTALERGLLLDANDTRRAMREYKDKFPTDPMDLCPEPRDSGAARRTQLLQERDPVQFTEFSTALYEATWRMVGRPVSYMPPAAYAGVDAAELTNVYDGRQRRAAVNAHRTPLERYVGQVNFVDPEDHYRWQTESHISPMFSGLPSRWAGQDGSRAARAMGADSADASAPLDGRGEELQEDPRAVSFLMHEALVNHARRKDTESTTSLLRGVHAGREVDHFEAVSFCMLRGLCGFLGPHQEFAEGAPPDQQVLIYSYPSAQMSRYAPLSMMHAHAAEEEEVPRHLAHGLCARGDALYADPKRGSYHLDTDFAGNVIAASRKAAAAADRSAAAAAAASGSGAALLGTAYGEGHESAKPVLWAPIDKSDESVTYSDYAHSVCEASVYEFMAASLKSPTVSDESDTSVRRLNTAAAAVAKLRQLPSLTAVLSSRDGERAKFLGMPNVDAAHDPYVCATRPAMNCSARGQPKDASNLYLQVDAGLARYSPLIPKGPPPGPRPGVRIQRPAASGGTQADLNRELAYPLAQFHPTEEARLAQTHPEAPPLAVPLPLVSSWLREGMEHGWRPPEDSGVLGRQDGRFGFGKRHFSLFMQRNATNEPFSSDRTPRVSSRQAQTALGVDPLDLQQEVLHAALARGVVAVDELSQIDCESEYIASMQAAGGDEQKHVFGVGSSMEDAARGKRADIWADAMREIAISGDRLYRFVVELTGAIGEAADSAVAWEDDDLKQCCFCSNRCLAHDPHTRTNVHLQWNVLVSTGTPRRAPSARPPSRSASRASTPSWWSR